jgi:excinuclease ABC subunit C
MSKGENRNAGEEWFHQFDKDSFTLPKNNSVMYYLQRLRDEAHRFAITTHRKKRAKAALID